jgi:hypothetical protein
VIDGYLRMDDLNFFGSLLIFAIGLPDRAELGRGVGLKVLVSGVVEAPEEEGPLCTMAIEVCLLTGDGFGFGPVVGVLRLATGFALLPVVLIIKFVSRRVELI